MNNESNMNRDDKHVKLAIILGTRPEIIKMSPVIRECEQKNMDYFILHTGQHYSYNMDRIFFEQLELPEARYNLDVGSCQKSSLWSFFKLPILQSIRKSRRTDRKNPGGDRAGGVICFREKIVADACNCLST